MIVRPIPVSRQLRSALVLIRPLNCLIGAASVAVGAFLAGGTVSLRSGVAAAMTFLVCAGAYVVNDYFDVAADKLTKPRRPLAAGDLPRRFALAFAAALWAGAAVLAVVAGRVALAGFAVWVLALWLYSSMLKCRGLWGHLTVSIIAASGFLLGAATEGRLAAGIVPAVLATAFHLARETAKSAADAAGDAAVGVRTLAVRIGEGPTLRLTLWLILAAVVASLMPAVLGMYGIVYLLIVLAAVVPLAAASMHRLAVARGRSGGAAAAASSVARLLKLAMLAGLAALCLARY